nr:maleylpyruvate isomerase N-terminal domain-containing protein [Streptomyces sp. DSM 41633]
MPTNEADHRPLHRTVVLRSAQVVDRVRGSDLDRPTPCAEWTLADLLAHMTAQHRGFAAAARGHGADESVWDAGTVADAIRADPAGTYAAAAHDVLGSAESRLHHQTPEVVRALKDLPPSDFPLLSGVVADRGVAATAAQDFDFNLDIVIAGLERFLAG